MTRFDLVLWVMLLGPGSVYAAAPAAAPSGSVASYTATSSSVSGAPDAIRIDILRWSSDAERARLMDAWNLKAANVNGRGGRAGAGRGGAARGGAGGAGRG